VVNDESVRRVLNSFRLTNSFVLVSTSTSISNGRRNRQLLVVKDWENNVPVSKEELRKAFAILERSLGVTFRPKRVQPDYPSEKK